MCWGWSGRVCRGVFLLSGCDVSTGWREVHPGPSRWCGMARGGGAFRGTLVFRGVRGGEEGHESFPFEWMRYGVDDSSSRMWRWS